MRKDHPPSTPIEIEIDGKKYSGSYTVERGVVTVGSPTLGRKSTQLGGSSAGSIARIMLRELVDEAKNQGVDRATENAKRADRWAQDLVDNLNRNVLELERDLLKAELTGRR